MGFQVFNSYIDLLYPTEDRRERLIDSYFFNCQCDECTSKSKVRADLYTQNNTPFNLHVLNSGDPAVTSPLFASFVVQDNAKMEIRKKLSSPPEPEEIRAMVHYAKNVIEEFRRAKHYKNILSGSTPCLPLVS